MGKEAYIKLLKGGGQQYKKSNLYMLPNKGATVEERAASKICPPPKLNPDYGVNPKIQRVGKIQLRTQTQQPQQCRQQSAQEVHPDVLRLIYGAR
jgi:hypothetical protein